ncbi:P protein-like [Teleopsis dalmanni]|uniref:P protein-like n=1 Tax=Teleopsis dalmanni TaxID=139649 RepID=UPI0018CEF555|nr:P protein-like [Teleopsis dalmanni]
MYSAYKKLTTRKPNDEVTEGALEIWRTLPERIRQDSSLALFRQEHERLHGGYELADVDPIPTEDIDIVKENRKNSNVFSQIYRDVENTVEDQPDDGDANASKSKDYLQWLKISILMVVWCLFTVFLMSTHDHVDELKLINVPKNGSEKVFPISPSSLNRLNIQLKGPFDLDVDTVNNQSNSPQLRVHIKRSYFNASGHEMYRENVSSLWNVVIVHPNEFHTTKETKKDFTYEISPINAEWAQRSNSSELNLHFITTIDADLPLEMSLDKSPIYKKEGIIYATLVLCGLYVLIVWEIVNRTFAAIIASTMSVGILAALNAKPSTVTIMTWIDVEPLLLLFGMMILVAILSETGIFDYMAVYAYKITNGHLWPLIKCLCFFTAVVSSILDNVTTVLLMTPVTIRLCEVMSLNPVPILMCMVIYSNIGGAATPVGDPPNVIIASNNFVSKNGVNFAVFTLHMAPAIILIMLQSYLQLRFKYRHISDLQFKDSPEVEELRREIHVWKRAAASLSAYSKDEDLVRETLLKKVNRLKRSLKKRMAAPIEQTLNYEQTLQDLQAKYVIRNKPLLIKCSAALVFVITLFFLHSVPELQPLSMGWTALLGAIFLIILADIEDMEAILARVEWSTLLFFAALFVLMEALTELGLIECIGSMTEDVILSVSEGFRLMVAILIILWVSAMASAFVDNIPLTTMMIKIIISLSQNSELDLPLQPLVWALTLGAGCGSNGTLIAACANVVCAGVAEQHGYKFTFREFFKVGFPVMIGSIVVSTAYLIVCHVFFTWH